MNWKYDYKVHFETVIRNMRFDNLSDVYSFLTDAAWHAEYNDDVITMEDFIDLYRDTPGSEHIDFEKPCRYYLVIRGVENVEDFKNG